MKMSEETFNQAVATVQEGGSIRGTAKKFGISKSTLEDKVKSRYAGTRKGIKPVLSKDEEQIVCDYVISSAEAGYPVTEKILMLQVGDALKFLGRSAVFKKGLPGRGWVRRFLKRHPELSKRTANNLSKRRVVTEVDVRGWFDTVTRYLESKNALQVLQHPERVFNMDESSFNLVPKKQKVIAAKTSKNVQSLTSNSEKENYTVLISASAAGELPPPLILFPYKSRMPTSVVRSVPKGWGIGHTDSGWMNTTAFYDFIVKVFYPWTIQRKLEFPIILFVDGHSSHATFETIKFCRQKGIILVSLLPNATHFLQPLDVAFFAPMKAVWEDELKMWRFEHQGAKLTRHDFAPLLEQTLANMTGKTDALINGFRKCGLFPFTPNAIDYKSLPAPESAPSALVENIQRGPEHIDTSPSNPSPSECATTFLQMLNSKLSVAQKASFEEHRNKLVWSGDLEDTSLFTLWRNLMDEVEGPPEYLIVDSSGLDNILCELPTNSPVDCYSYRINPEDDEEGNLNVQINPDPNDTVFEAEEMELNHDERKDNDPNTLCHANSVDDPQESNSCETSPLSDGASDSFSECQQADNVLLDETETDNLPHKKGNRSRKRRIFPAVATSDEWMEMYLAEANEKQQQEDLKRKRIDERHSKQIQKEQEKLRKIEERQMKQRAKMEEIMNKKNNGSKDKKKRQ